MKRQNKKKQILLLVSSLAAAALTLSGCSSQTGSASVNSTAQTAFSGTEDMADTEYTSLPDSFGEVTARISCSGNTVSVSGNGASASGTAITITAAGTYELTGTLDSGSLEIAAGKTDHVVLVLDNFHLTSTQPAPIYGKKSGQVTILLKAGSDNSVSAVASEAQDSDGPDAAVYTASDLYLSGEGALTITAQGQYGIRSMENLTVSSGGISITSDSGGIKAQSLLTVEGGSFSMDTEDDAFHSKQDMVINGGTFSVSTGDDAFHADSQLTVNDGSIKILTSYEGLEGSAVTINGGTIDLTSQDDGINAASDISDDIFIRITGGEIHVNAGGDGLDSNGDLFVEGGVLYVDGPVSGGDSALDYDGKATITGGTVLAAGSAGMFQSFKDQSTQPVITVYYGQTMAAGTAVTLKGADGSTLCTYSPCKEFSAVVLSCPGLTAKETYTLVSGEDSQELTINGIVNQLGANRAERGNGMHRGERPEGKTPDGQETGTPPEDISGNIPKDKPDDPVIMPQRLTGNMNGFCRFPHL